jgi:putative ABC transport system substrate-binding protein
MRYAKHDSNRELGRLHVVAIALALVAFCVALAACSPLSPQSAEPQPEMIRIGFLSSVGEDSPAAAGGYKQLLAGLSELGYEVGRNVAMEYRSAEGDATKYPALVAELVSLPVKIIVIGDSRALVPALEGTKTIPIVTAVGDIRAVGMVANVSSPEANLTGMSNQVSGLSGKRLELLKEAAPRISRVAVLRNPSDPGMATYWQETQNAAQTVGVQLLPFDVQQPAQLSSVLGQIATARPDGLAVLPEPLTNVQNQPIAEFAVAQRVPSIAGWRPFVDNGGLMYIGVSRAGTYYRTASFVHRLLQGATPSDLPVEQPTQFEFVLNLRAARTLGLSFPPSILNQASETIPE